MGILKSNLLVACLGVFMLEAASGASPNIVYILADDMGYGDPAYAGGKIPTPNLDRLAKEGMRFTDAHTSSAVCTPTRYGILTGRYNWRSPLKKSVLWGLSAPLIPESRPTVATMLRNAGYGTSVIGKWHLGLKWAKLDEPRKASALMLTLAIPALAEETKPLLAQAEGAAEKNDTPKIQPTRETAVDLMQAMKAAALRFDREKLSEVFHRPPDIPLKNFRKDIIRGFIEVHHDGDGPIDSRKLDFSAVDQLVKDGKWGTAEQVLDKDYARRQAAYHEVAANTCYGLTTKDGETKTIFHWNGESLIILDYTNPRISALYEEAVQDNLKSIAKGDPTGSGMSYGMLWFFGPKAASAIPTLQGILKNDEQHVDAASALWAIDRRADVSVPPIRKVLEDKNKGKWTRIQAARVLGMIGSHAKDALPSLNAAKDEGDADIRKACEEAIQKITGDGE